MSNHRYVVLSILLALLCILTTTSRGGRNADGALIIHTDASVTYTSGYDYCDSYYPDPGACIHAETEVDPQGGAAVLWLLAAFPAGSSPGVTVAQFGIEHSVSGGIIAYGPCGPNVIEIASPGFPESGSGNSIAFYPASYGTLFPIYWFAIDGAPGDTFGSSKDQSAGQAVFVDEASPAETDQIDRFGLARWGSPGDNDCPPSVERRDANLGQIKAGYR